MSKNLSEKVFLSKVWEQRLYLEDDVKTLIKKLNIWWHSDDDQRSMKEFLKDEAGSDLI